MNTSRWVTLLITTHVCHAGWWLWAGVCAFEYTMVAISAAVMAIVPLFALLISMSVWIEKNWYKEK